MKINFVEKFDDENDVCANDLLDDGFLEFAGLENFGLVERSTLSNLIPNALDVFFLILVETLQEVIVEFFVVHQLKNGECYILLNNSIRLEFRASNFLRNISGEWRSRLFEAFFNDEVRSSNQSTEGWHLFVE